MIHKLADVQTQDIGTDTLIWQYAVVLQGAKIGCNCNINCHTFIENDVIIGNNVTVKSGVYLWNGLRLHDDVFIGPNVTFVNDKLPRSKQYPDVFLTTTVEKGASVGAGAVILGGIHIGCYALIGAGSVVTKNVRAYSLVVGNPAKQVGWVDEKGNKLRQISDQEWQAADGTCFEIIQGNLVKKIQKNE